MKGPNFREMTDDELRKELEELAKKAHDLRFRKVTDIVENPAEFRRIRRSVARIRTLLRERELVAAAVSKKKA